MIELDNKSVLVTGAAGGFGQAIVTAFATSGASVFGADISYPEGATQRDGWMAIHCDVSSEPSVSECMALIADHSQGIDILINNAGIFPAANFEKASMDLWRKVFAVNLEGVVLMTRACIPHMKEQGWGRILSLGSNTFDMGWPGLVHYTASKGAVIGMTRGLATELGEYGITVNVIAPTLTKTPGSNTMYEEVPDMVQSVVDRQAIRRHGVPEDVANALLLLASDEASFITGQTIAADGGLAKR